MLFNEKFKGELRLENYEWASRELGLAGKPLTFYLLLLYTIRNDYRYNTLSGRNAFAMWNVVLLLTKNAYKSEKGFTPAERAGVLKTAAHLVFFRDAAIWGKRGESLARKLIRAGHTPESLFPL